MNSQAQNDESAASFLSDYQSTEASHSNDVASNEESNANSIDNSNDASDRQSADYSEALSHAQSQAEKNESAASWLSNFNSRASNIASREASNDASNAASASNYNPCTGVTCGCGGCITTMAGTAACDCANCPGSVMDDGIEVPLEYNERCEPRYQTAMAEPPNNGWPDDPNNPNGVYTDPFGEPITVTA